MFFDAKYITLKISVHDFKYPYFNSFSVVIYDCNCV